MSSKLIIENLEKVYKGDVQTIAVRDFNLSSNQGDSVTIAGPSGSGKTTILLCVAGLLEPTYGKIIVNDKLVNSLTDEELVNYRRHTVGMVFQSFNLIEYFTVYENIVFPLWIAQRTKKEIKERVEKLLEELDISRYAQTYPRFLSGGEQQRVAIGIALANNPQIILADEPTGNLDRETADIVIDLLFKEAQEHNKILLLATHDEKIIEKSKQVISLEKRVV